MGPDPLFIVGVKELIPLVDQVLPVVTGNFIVAPQDDGSVGTGFLAETAKDATAQVNLIDLGEALMSRPLRGFDPDAVGRADRGAEFTGHAEQPSLRIPGQLMETPEPGVHNHLFLRILNGYRTGEKGTEG
jgi:hypothetical protein